MEISPAVNVPVGYRSIFVWMQSLRENDLLRAIHTEKTQPGGLMNMDEQSQRCLHNPNETLPSLNFVKWKAAKKDSSTAW